MNQLSVDVFKNSFDLIDDYVYIKDVNYNYIYANKKVCELFNTSLEDIAGKDDSFFFDLKISDDIKINDTSVIEDKKVVEKLETMVIMETGEKRHYKATKQPLYDSQNNLIGLFGLSKDITEQKIAQDKLEEKESLLRLVLDENPDVIVMKDFEGKFLLVNKTVADLYQSDPEEMIGKDDGDYISKEQAEFFKKNIQKVMKSGKTEIVYEDSTDVSSGETRHFKSIKKPLKDKDGNDQILVIATDVTDIVKTKEELKYTASDLQKAQSLAKIGFWKLDVVHNELDWSDEIFNIFEIDKNQFEASYEAFLKTIHPDDRAKVNKAYTDSLQDKLPYEITHRLLMKDGSIKWVEEKCKTTFDKDGNPLISIGTVLDITQKKEYENLISKEKNFISTVFENANAIIAVIDSDGIMSRLNKYGEEFTGYTKEEVASKPYFWSRFLNKEVRGKVENIIYEANQGNIISSYQNSWVSKECEERVFEWSNQLVKKADGSMDYLFTIGIDINDKIQMQDQLLKQKNEQENLLSLFDKGDANLFKWNNDESWSIEYASENVELLTGYTNDEFISKEITYNQCIHPDDITHAYNEVKQALEENADFFKHDPYRIITKDGSVKWVLDTTVTQKNKDNEITHFIGYISNITSLKKQEEKLRESELRWKFAIEGNGDGLWDWNLEDDSVFFSTEWKRMLGFGEDEIQDSLEEWSKRVHPNELDQVYSDINAYLDGKTDMYRNEHQVLCKDGSYKWVLDRGIAIKRDENNKPLRMIGTHTDIDQEKKLQKELSQARIDADKANKSKSEFLANMSHEIRTPMTGLLGFVDRLQKSESDTERKKQFQVIRNSGETLLNIINDILDFSKIESGKLEIESSPFELNEILKTSVHSFHYLASSKNINLINAVNENVPICVNGDETRLKQVVFNILNNAIKFTSSGGSITLQAYFNEVNNILHVAVIDTGVGIAKENTQKIFQAFSQEDASTTRKFGGTGLGLSISSSFIKLMGGELKVESEVGQGSKFYFDIPIETCSNTDIKDDKEIAQVHNDSVNFKGNVLIVEDNKTNQMLLSMILDDHGVSYDIASDGAEGVLMNKLNNYEMILMDENMPIMNGIEATKNIREQELETDNHIPIIAVTANALKSDRERFMDVGMDDYISKPYTEEDIIRVLYKYLGLVQ